MSIFREKALRRLSSPDDLDEAIVAAAPRHWLAFAAAVVVVGCALAWGFLGSVPTRVEADGILLKRDSEVFSASAEGSGELISVKVRVGENVAAGQVVAELDQAVVLTRIALARENLEKSQERLAEEREAREADRAFRTDFHARRRQAIEERIANAERRIAVLGELVRDLRGLLERGLIARSRLLDTENELIQARESLSEQSNALVRLEEEAREQEQAWRERLLAAEKEVATEVDELEDLREQLVRDRTIDAPISGIVTEISASLGDVLSPGTPVVRIVSDAAEMEALLFVRPADGKLVQPGLLANVEPSVARKEEFGTILAEVRSVSHLPLSASAIQAMLHNEKLVEQFTRDGAPVAVRARLREAGGPDRKFEWTGGRGPGFSIEPGTLAAATITVRRQRPAALVLPFLKSLLGA